MRWRESSPGRDGWGWTTSPPGRASGPPRPPLPVQQPGQPQLVAGSGPIGRPAARDLVYLEEGTTFVVPSGRIFVISGIGFIRPSGQFNSSLSLTINGVQQTWALPPHEHLRDLHALAHRWTPPA